MGEGGASPHLGNKTIKKPQEMLLWKEREGYDWDGAHGGVARITSKIIFLDLIVMKRCSSYNNSLSYTLFC